MIAGLHRRREALAVPDGYGGEGATAIVELIIVGLL